MRPTAHGRILFWEGASLWVLAAPPGQRYPKTAPHAHHAVQVTLALTGRVTLEGEGGRVSGEALAVAPDTLHAFEGTGLAAHLFVAPEGKAGRQLARSLFARGPLVPLTAGRLGELPGQLETAFADPNHTDEALRDLGRSLLARLAGDGVQAKLADPRIVRLLASVAARLDESPSSSDVARLVGLSPGRARHLFVEQTGLPFRTYMLWLRLLRALEQFAEGASLTAAAHGAGFADSAHLSRTFRRMFGINAATLCVSGAASRPGEGRRGVPSADDGAARFRPCD